MKAREGDRFVVGVTPEGKTGVVLRPSGRAWVPWIVSPFGAFWWAKGERVDDPDSLDCAH